MPPTQLIRCPSCPILHLSALADLLDQVRVFAVWAGRCRLLFVTALHSVTSVIACVRGLPKQPLCHDWEKMIQKTGRILPIRSAVFCHDTFSFLVAPDPWRTTPAQQWISWRKKQCLDSDLNSAFSSYNELKLMDMDSVVSLVNMVSKSVLGGAELRVWRC